MLGNFNRYSFKFLLYQIKLFSEVQKFKIDLSEDIKVAKKQVSWRIRNMGQLEIEVLILKWWEKNEKNLELPDLVNFAKEVLEMEIPELNKYLLQSKSLPANSKYLKELVYFYKI